MTFNTQTPDDMVQLAIDSMRRGGPNLLNALNELPAAIYFSNKHGLVTHYNNACTAFAGRKPRLGQDRWCVTWKLYTEEGQFLPHDQCPMAVAIREKRAIRGISAVAERPDGIHVRFTPHPTPLFDDEGNLTGAVNLLLDITGQTHAQTLRTQATKCRHLVNLMYDQHSMRTLELMATDYDQRALSIEQAH